VYHPVAREAHYAGVPELAFSADGNLLASSRGIATVIWDLDPRHWQARAKQIANREFTDSERDQYLRPAPR
jgi:hypothetical protein